MKKERGGEDRDKVWCNHLTSFGGAICGLIPGWSLQGDSAFASFCAFVVNSPVKLLSGGGEEK